MSRCEIRSTVKVSKRESESENSKQRLHNEQMLGRKGGKRILHQSFAQVVPWIEVLLHTLIDWMRTEEAEGESRKVNHSLFGVSLFVLGLSVVGLFVV